MVHIFREHDDEADVWAEKGVSGGSREREDESNVVWPEVAGLRGFWDRSCRHGVCGARQLDMVFIQALV